MPEAMCVGLVGVRLSGISLVIEDGSFPVVIYETPSRRSPG